MQKLRIVTPTQATQVQQAMTALQPTRGLSITQPLKPTASFQKQRQAYQYKPQQTQTFLANYNDPTELNSYIDALTNREAVSKKFGDTWGTLSTLSGTVSVLAFAGSIIAGAIPGGQPVAAALATVGKIAAAPAIPAAINVTVEKGIKPIVAGKPKEALLNTLMNLGETADAVANPIKGLVLEGSEGFAKGTGLANGGRVNYDYDTGSFVTDMLLELVTDPMNWVDAAGGLTKIAKVSARADELLDPMYNTIVHNASELADITINTELKNKLRVPIKNAINSISKARVEKLSPAAQDALIYTTKKNIRDGFASVLKKEMPNLKPNEIAYILDTAIEDQIHKNTIKSVTAQIADLTYDGVSTQVIDSLSSMLKYSDDFQKALTKRAFMSSGYGLGVEIVRKGIPGIAQWANNFTLKALKKSQYFDRSKGLDIKHWTEAKNIWEASYKYTQSLAQDNAQRDLNAFYSFASAQFNRDREVITRILQDGTDYLQKSARITACIEDLYDLDFNAYVDTLKQINTIEQGIYSDYINYLESIKRTLEKQALTVPAGARTKTIASLFPDSNSVAGTLTDKQTKLIDEIKDSVTVVNDEVRLKDKAYTIKMNNAFINAQLLQDKNISVILEEIASDENAGAFLNKVISDIRVYDPEVLCNTSRAAINVKRAGLSFRNIRELFVGIANMPLEKIQGVQDTAFRRYIIDQIFGFKKTPAELLAEFDSITMPSLKNGIEMLLFNAKKKTNFKFKDYPNLENQIASVFKQYLARQVADGVDHVGAVVVQNFTNDISELIRVFPEYKQQLIHLAAANDYIRDIMTNIRQLNKDLLNTLYASGKTIFEVASDRKLVDYGLARSTVIAEEVLGLFDLDHSVPGHIVKNANSFGSAIKHMAERLAQHAGYFAKKDNITAINNAYKNFFKFTKTKSRLLDHINYPVLTYLKRSNDTYTQFATVSEFLKLARANLKSNEFKICLARVLKDADASSALYHNLMHPEGLMSTDFAWDALAQSAWVAEKALNENIINGINAYRNLSLLPKKITNDFQAVRDALSTNKLDRPKMLQQERYIKAASKVNDVLQFLEDHYANLFNRNIAEERINQLWDIYNRHPRFQKYKSTIERLQQYWDGDLTFEQSAKHLRGTEQYKDTFTPFWNEVKEMNKLYYEIKRSEMVKEHLMSALPKNVSELYFIDQPHMGDALISVFNDVNCDLSDPAISSWYTLVLDELVKENEPIPWEYLPAKFKEIDFKIYHDVFGIENPQLLWKYAEEDVAGFHNIGTRNIAAILDKARMPEKRWRPIDLEFLAGVYKHETAHAILDTLFNTETASNYRFQLSKAHKEYLDKFEQRFIDKFGTEVHRICIGNLDASYNALKRLLNYPEEHFKYIALEELYTFTIGQQTITLLGKHPDLIIENAIQLDEFSAELMDELKILVQNNPKLQAAQNYEDWYRSRTKLKFDVEYDPITPWDPVRKQQELNKTIHKATNANALGGLYNLFNYSPEELITELAYRHRFVAFHKSDLADSRLRGMYKKFRGSLPNNVLHVEDNKGWVWLVLTDPDLKMQGRQAYLNTKPLLRNTKSKRFGEFALVDQLINQNLDPLNSLKNPGITKTLDELDDAVETLTGSRLGDSHGEHLTKGILENIYTEMPEEVQKALPELEQWLDNSFFESYQYNESVLGTSQNKARLGVNTSDNMLINLRNTIVQAQGYLKPRNEYVNTVFDSLLCISSPNSVWEHFSDQDLLEALQANRDFKLVALVDDKKYGLKTREILPTSVEAIQKARELGAVIIPLQTYKDMYNIVNHRLGSAGVAKLWSRIIYLYKFGYLCRPGAWIRNFIDTNLKTRLELKEDYHEYMTQARGILQDVKNMQKYVKQRQEWFAEIKQASNNYVDAAQRILNDIDKMKDFVQLRNQGGVIPSQEIKKWFDLKQSKTLTYEQFLELDRDFLSQGIAGNIMGDLYAGEGGGVWRAITHTSGKIVDTFNKTEEVNRLATFLFERDKGLEYTQSLLRIDKIHFDYSFKTKAEQLSELVFPFTTFSLRNYSYWAEMLEKHPWIMRNYIHLMKPNWDFQDYTPEELARDQRVQTQILYGQLKLGEFQDKLITFKANPSIQDAIQMFSDPINNVYEKLAAPIAVPLKLAQNEYVQPLNIIPIIGPAMQSAKTMIKTGSPMPSAIGVQKKSTGNVKFKNKNLSGTNKYTDKTYRTPKYRNNYVFDSYATKGIARYRLNMYPVIDVYHDIKMNVSTNVYNKIKNKVKTDVYKGVRYSLRLDTNRLR